MTSLEEYLLVPDLSYQPIANSSNLLPFFLHQPHPGIIHQIHLQLNHDLTSPVSSVKHHTKLPPRRQDKHIISPLCFLGHLFSQAVLCTLNIPAKQIKLNFNSLNIQLVTLHVFSAVTFNFLLCFWRTFKICLPRLADLKATLKTSTRVWADFQIPNSDMQGVQRSHGYFSVSSRCQNFY